jgi:hypothetical protein
VADALLPERALVGRRAQAAVLLGEVNLPYDQQLQFFGGPDGDKLTMQFDFIAMQRLYLSLARCDAGPLVSALTERPATSPDSHWATFVRNHDELTLDKLSDDERAEVFAAFGPEERMQVYGRGLIRRLPPMLAGDPRRIRSALTCRSRHHTDGERPPRTQLPQGSRRGTAGRCAALRRTPDLASRSEVIGMSEERDVTTTGWVDRGPEGRTGATAVPDPRAEVQTPPAAGPGSATPPAGGQQKTMQPVSAEVPQPPQSAPQPAPQPVPPPTPEREDAGGPAAAAPAGGHATAPVSGRPRPRLPGRDPRIRMGPWAPVAGAVLGLLLGVVVVVLLAPAVRTFAERLSLVFVVLGLSLLGAGGTLLADEVRLLRRGARAVEARAESVGVIVGLLNGLTPARLLIMASAFCLLLSAYVPTRG